MRCSPLLFLSLTCLVACGGPDGGDDDDDDGGTSGPWTDDTAADGSIVELQTSLGTIVVDLDEDKAPISTGNFIEYVDAGFYDGSDGQGATIFHRVIADFVAQGGGYTEEGATKDTMSPIPLETDVGLSNLRGTIGMARTSDPASGTSQFYFNLVDNTGLDYQDASNPGYAVFGEVVGGMEIVDEIGEQPVDGSDLPLEAVVITSATVL